MHIGCMWSGVLVGCIAVTCQKPFEKPTDLSLNERWSLEER